jgi:hypothetical protein
MKYSLISFLLILTITTNGQQAKNSLLFELVTEKRLHAKTDPVVLFAKSSVAVPSKIQETVSEKLILSLDKQASLELFKNKPASISLLVPSVGGQDHKLEMIQQDIANKDEFSFGSIEGNGIMKKAGTEQGLHYRGYINGDPYSIAGFSIFSNGEVMGVFCNAIGNYNLGKTGDQYIVYSSSHMLASLGFECGTSELPVENIAKPAELPPPTNPIPPPLLCKKVRIYWEADYKLYSNNFSSNLTSTANYLTGLFNQVAIMYQNEGILIELTDTYIWITQDPYNTSTSSNGLATFKSRWNSMGNSFKADLALLIDGAPTNNGGIAYLLTNNLCNRAFAYGYANIYAFFNTVPTYSWDVEVLTHEMGHMMGSNHTHWCGWNTGAGSTGGAIDDCYTTEAGGAGGCASCAATTSTNPSPPAGFKGTVMSYCHLRAGIGINLANGFGPLPQGVIRNTVNNASCALYDNKWTGTVSTAWENPANWNCGSVPNATTDVTIPSGLVNYPVVNSAAICRRIRQEPNTSVLVKTGFSLMLTGPPN